MFEAFEGMFNLPFSLGVAHYDAPPPSASPDLDALPASPTPAYQADAPYVLAHVTMAVAVTDAYNTRNQGATTAA